eukprot:CAMPEP_0172463572 /NCGR_PEP_ID=MMETSP1065-20121228/47645_1 /TAXON_ID=265537 /ORGANISM="Amphiprora paludosa, Strain CCMP125" /LENGTH=82 /DNA_ID=CAMNT_0013219565 /DNA_START=48 /DNA_END=292 /DNA_ORIENTATION=+
MSVELPHDESKGMAEGDDGAVEANEDAMVEDDTPKENLGFCGHVGREIAIFYKNLSLTSGDLGSLSQLFFDNLSTLLGALFA